MLIPGWVSILDAQDDLSPVFHPGGSRVRSAFEAIGVGGATGRGAEPQTSQTPRRIDHGSAEAGIDRRRHVADRSMRPQGVVVVPQSQTNRAQCSDASVMSASGTCPSNARADLMSASEKRRTSPEEPAWAHLRRRLSRPAVDIAADSRRPGADPLVGFIGTDDTRRAGRAPLTAGRCGRRTAGGRCGRRSRSAPAIGRHRRARHRRPP